MPVTEAPKKIVPKNLDDYLEIMSKSVFQSGMSWKVVESKWPTTREAFHDFQIGAVAAMDEMAVDALADDTRVIRNRRKLQAITDNARRMIELDEEYGTFQKYLRSHDSFWDLVKDLRKQFKFLGDMGAYVWLYIVGEEVPPHDQFEAERPRKKTK
ncbi:MAG: DNA-3-methyladenine glycosylase I [Chloroflexi bacterium]|nr:DNA-3-methyladenine glycosylase I [Chloroflexota bacterium]